MTKRIKITVSNPFPIFPPVYGGQLRVYNLYLQLSRWFDINVVAYANPGIRTHRRQLSEGLSEVRVPKTLEHCKIEAGLIEEVGAPISDIALLKYHQYTPEYLKILHNCCKDSEVLVCSHPYTFNTVRAVGKRRIWYDAHNVEYLLKKNILPECAKKEELLQLISEAEEECCNRSELVLSCSQEDKESLCKLYNLNENKVIVVPNGTNATVISYLLPDERMKMKEKEAGRKKSAIFVGSYHGPNLIAVDYIVKMAHELPEVQFIIVGSAGKWLENRHIPENVTVTGVLEEKDKAAKLKISDIALNPMTYGSGTNLKILEYFAYGLPVISTPVGVRGLNLSNGKQAVVCDIDSFTAAIRKLLAAGTAERASLVKEARRFVEENYDWKVIAQGLIDELKHGEVFPILRDINYRLNNIKNGVDINTPNEFCLRKIKSRKVYIWGAGSAGRSVLKLLRNAGICINGFIDSDSSKCGNFVDGVEVCLPTSIYNEKTIIKPFIIVASTYAEEIEKTLGRMNYKSNDDYLVQDINSPYLCLY